MKRNVTDVLRRSFENTLANWPLLALKVASTFVIGMIVVASLIATIVPLAISIGLRGVDFKDVASVEEVLRTLLTSHWFALLVALGVITVVLFVVVALVSFLEAGVMQIVVDGERRVRGDLVSRDAMRSFTMQRFIAGATAHGWPVFWIYNIAWTAASAIILLPLTATLAGILILGEQPAAIAAGCAGLLVSLLLFLAIALVTNVWSRKAIAIAVARSAGAIDSLRAAWTEMTRDFLRHFAVAFVLAALSFGVSGALSIMSLLGGADRTGMLRMAFMPMQIGISLLSAAVSAGISVWVSAAFASLTVESEP